VGNSGLLLAQNCADCLGIWITQAWITLGPLYVHFQEAVRRVQKFSNYHFSVSVSILLCTVL